MKATIIAIGKCKKNSPEAAIISEYVETELSARPHIKSKQERGIDR